MIESLLVSWLVTLLGAAIWWARVGAMIELGRRRGGSKVVVASAIGIDALARLF